MDRNKVKVWTCKIIVSDNFELPAGFDSPPRRAAIEAVEAAGVDVLGCSSGWGGQLTKDEEAAFNAIVGDIYYAGTLDEQKGGTH